MVFNSSGKKSFASPVASAEWHSPPTKSTAHKVSALHISALHSNFLHSLRAVLKKTDGAVEQKMSQELSVLQKQFNSLTPKRSIRCTNSAIVLGSMS